jgi:hypothetical protein
MASSGAAARKPIQVNSTLDREFHTPIQGLIEEEFSSEQRPFIPYCHHRHQPTTGVGG